MKFALFLIALVVVTQEACGFFRRSQTPYDRCQSCGPPCGLGEGEYMCRGNRPCVPLVVRPQDVPKPVLPLPVSLAPVPSPCNLKKAIVKPAVLPRPVCRPTIPHVHSCSYDHNVNHHHSSSTILGSSVLGSGTYSDGCSGAYSGGCSGAYSEGSYHGPRDCSPVLHGGKFPDCRENQANCAPADAVSLALAYKMAQENNIHNIQSEDRLHFGFRKIPQELPPRRIIQNNIPEEKIFSLNGQIVELKPVKVTNQQSLAEEAADALTTIQDEEEEAAREGIYCKSPIRRVSLGELGYGPAKPKSPVFVDVPAANIVETVVDAAAEASSSACGCGCNPCCNSCNKGFIAGNVVYKTVPKPEQICTQPVPVPDSCESGEVNISEEQQPSVQVSCVPVCVKKCHHHCNRHSSVTIQKYC